MKPRIATAASLLALTGLAFFLGSRTRPLDRSALSPATNQTLVRVTNTLVQWRTNAPVAKKEYLFEWALLETDDLKLLAENMRAVGCPENRVRHLILGEINERFAHRRDALNSGQAFHYWEAQLTPDKPRTSRELQRKLRELKKEQYALVKEVLGIDLQEEIQKLNGRSAQLQRMYGSISAEKQKLLSGLHDKFEDLEARIYEEGDGEVFPEDEARLQALEKQHLAEIRQVLSAEEWFEYELRNSALGQTMRQSLVGCELAEPEFRTIFQWRQNFETVHGTGMEFLTPEKQSAKQRDWEQLNDQIRMLLGETRFADYQRGQNYDFQELFKLARRYTLPREVAVRAYELNLATETRKRELESDLEMPEPSRLVAVASLEDEADKRLLEILGEKAFQAYQQRGGVYSITPVDNSSFGVGP